MNTNWIALVGAPLLAAPLTFIDGAAQQPQRAGALTRVQSPQAQPAATFDAAAWKERLATKDLDAREHDFEALVDEARGNEAARKQLAAWSHDDADPELAWTSRMALRELRNDGRSFGAPGWSSTQGGPPWNNLRSRFDDLQQRFGGLDDMFEDLQRQMDDAFRGMGGMGMPGPGFGAQPMPQGGQGGVQRSQSQSYSMQVGPDGVKVEVSEDVDGKQETKTYEAKSLDELYDAHPELKDKLGMHVDIQDGQGGSARSRQFWGRGNPFGGGTLRRLDDDNRPALPLQGGAMRTDVLGVQISTPSADERTQAKIDEGVGLKVESVQPGTIASRIGMQRGDIVVDVNGRTVKSVDDVHETLRDRKPDQDVSVTVVDDAGKRRVLTWSAASEGKKADERRF